MADALTILSSGALASAIVFLARSWISERLKAAIQHEYDQKLETHKAKLQSASEVEIEKLKSQLQIAASERSIKLSKVFEDQAETIAETYAKLVALITAIEHYTSIIEYEKTPPKAERRLKVGERMGEFFDYYKPRRIYLPKETQSQIDAFVNQLHLTAVKFMFDVEQYRQKPVDKAEEDTWFKTAEFMSKESLQILGNLDLDFKKILGLAEESKKA